MPRAAGCPDPRAVLGRGCTMRMQRIFALALVIAAALAMAVPALGDADVDGSPGLPDLDVRTGAIPPTAAQRAGAKALGADVSWNAVGTPSTLVRPGGALGATVGGDTATSAARTWLEGNRGLFRLSSATGLEPVNDSTLAGKATHAVTFRQAPGGLDVAGGGLVTIGVTKAGGAWRVVSASSTISGDETIAPGGARLSDAQAWQRAARSVGRHTSLARVQRVSIRKLGLGSGWKGLRVAGFSNVQQSRKVAFPTLTRGYVPAFETLVLDTAGAEPAAYRVIVDAQSGAVLSRESLVDNEGEPTARAAQAPADPNSLTFSGTLPATDGGCDTPQGPLTVSADSGGRAIDVFADATTPAQDIVLNLLQGTKVIASADTLRTPERIRFEPGGTIPAGQY